VKSERVGSGLSAAWSAVVVRRRVQQVSRKSDMDDLLWCFLVFCSEFCMIIIDAPV